MKTLVTGAAGHIGGNLVRALLAEGREVRVMLHRRDAAMEGLDVERVHGDMLDPDSLRAACDGVDTVHHLAAFISIEEHHYDQMFAINTMGTSHLVNACLQTGVKRLVHCSSIHALSHHPNDVPVDEERILAIDAKHMAYDRTKALAEEAVLKGVSRGLDAVIINPVGVLGPLDFELSQAGELLLRLANREMPGLIGSGFYWVDVRDVAAGSIGAELHGRSGERYIIHGRYAKVAELAQWVQTYTGSRPPRMLAPIWLAYAVAPFFEGWSRLTGKRPLFTRNAVTVLRCHQQIESEKAINELGFNPRPLEDTIYDALHWFAENGHIREGVTVSRGG